jgi:hypothetical protein
MAAASIKVTGVRRPRVAGDTVAIMGETPAVAGSLWENDGVAVMAPNAGCLFRQGNPAEMQSAPWRPAAGTSWLAAHAAAAVGASGTR